MRYSFLLGLILFGALTHARDAESVDVVLVLATDVSGSVEDSEYAIQKRGVVEALADPEVARALRQCAPGGVALTYVEWGGCGPNCADFATVVPFRNVSDQESLTAFSRDVGRAWRSFEGSSTDIQTALARSRALIDGATFTDGRRVIDLSTNGIQNVNHSGVPTPKVMPADFIEPLKHTRDEVVAGDISINVLVIDLPTKNSPNGGYKSLDEYHRDVVMGGEGAFTVLIHDSDQMHEALVRKLSREICAGAST